MKKPLSIFYLLLALFAIGFLAPFEANAQSKKPIRKKKVTKRAAKVRPKVRPIGAFKIDQNQEASTDGQSNMITAGKNGPPQNRYKEAFPRQSFFFDHKARPLPKPAYPAAAKAVKASGAVEIQVLIDEEGNVISASAISGHPLLRQAAEKAAREAKFTPTLLEGQRVKVSGIIVYNFVAQ